MSLSCTTATLTEPPRTGRLLKIHGCPPFKSNVSWDSKKFSTSRWQVDGYEWEIRFYPMVGGDYGHMDLELVFLSEARANKVTAYLSCRLVDPTSSVLEPSDEKISPPKSFQHRSDSSGNFFIISRSQAHRWGYLKDDSVALECTVTVLKDEEGDTVPSSNLQKDLGKFLCSKAGADVTFIVSGESVAAHKILLAARSPVFKAEFFGQIKETTSKRIKIMEMEAAVFKAMLHFIYTDKVPELDEKNEAATVMAQHLLAAADRYGLDLLKVICGRKIALGIDAGTVLAALNLAEQHGCSQLKSQCIEFILGASPEVLNAILATEGFKNMESSSPMLMELFKAAHGRIKEKATQGRIKE